MIFDGNVSMVAWWLDGRVWRCRNSYVEGRLRLAERERHRKAKPTEVTEVVPSEAELKEKMAQADAAMASLLQEEEEQKEEEEARKARREAKRDKKKKKKGNGGAKDDSLKSKEGDSEDKQKDAVSQEGSSGTNAAEEESCTAADTSDLEIITTFAALSLSESVGQQNVTNRNDIGPTKKTGKKKNRKKPEQGGSRAEVERLAVSPDRGNMDRKDAEAPEDNAKKGTVKIIRCHNGGTPSISSNKQVRRSAGVCYVTAGLLC